MEEKPSQKEQKKEVKEEENAAEEEEEETAKDKEKEDEEEEDEKEDDDEGPVKKRTANERMKWIPSGRRQRRGCQHELPTCQWLGVGKPFGVCWMGGNGTLQPPFNWLPAPPHHPPAPQPPHSHLSRHCPATFTTLSLFTS